MQELTSCASSRCNSIEQTHIKIWHYRCNNNEHTPAQICHSRCASNEQSSIKYICSKCDRKEHVLPKSNTADEVAKSKDSKELLQVCCYNTLSVCM